MNLVDKKRLFTVAEVSKAAGISRTSLIRLEESGFFKPCRIDPDTGYRYYDITNIVQIGRYMRLRNIGLTRKEITDFYRGSMDYDQFMEVQRQKLETLQRFINEFELRKEQKGYNHSFVMLPDITFFCEDITPSSYREAEMQAFLLFENVVVEGFRVIPDQPPILLAEDWTTLKGDSPAGGRYTVGVPVVPDSKQSKNDHCRHFPAYNAFSSSGFGGYSILPDLISKHYAELS